MISHESSCHGTHPKKNPMADGDVAPVLVLKLGFCDFFFRVPKQKGTTKNESMFVYIYIYMIYLLVYTFFDFQNMIFCMSL